MEILKFFRSLFFQEYIFQESKYLKSRTDSLTAEAENLREKKETSDIAVKETVTESKQQKHEIKELKEKIGSLELALNTMVSFYDVSFCAP